MEFKYVITPNGLLKISEIIILAIAFDFIVELIIDIENCTMYMYYHAERENCTMYYHAERDICCDEAPWQYYIFSVSAILVAILTLVALVAHVIMPAWMKQIKAKVAKVEIVFCVVLAILVLVGSVCLVFVQQVQKDGACMLGFIAVLLLLVECVFLYSTVKSASSYDQEQLI
ncbi:uncharacterized protein LOC117122455 [Anneissia japonica]|uniref:uncharacterized protein LOC117122455 n=1 Tax=Anneissia japonica TaxID=1529436 RepID=UPI00142583F9|nr:uncharacterized protein LOC117122455 [Anneissia japonica]